MLTRTFLISMGSILFLGQFALGLSAGDAPPAVSATNQDGAGVDLAELYGRRPVVLFFYPKSFTPGCTIEVQAFRDANRALADLDAAVFGVSQDDQDTQRKFCDKYGLKYDLLVDKGGALAKAFGVPAKGSYNARWSVIIGRDGKVLEIDKDVNADIKGHPQRVVSRLEQDWADYLATFKGLFNGKNLDGWEAVKASADTWTVNDGILKCSGKPVCYLRTKEEYSDYTLLLEFQYPERLGNAGVLVHITGPDKVWPKSIEPNLNVGQMGKFYFIGGAEAQHGRNPLRDVEIPTGRWHRYEITCKADTIELVLNGTLVNRATKSNLTSGKIGLQSERTPIWFRTISLRPAR